MSKILLKNDGVFVYDDYTGAKVALRLNELQNDQVQLIRRTVAQEPVAALVSPKVMLVGPVYASKIQMITDDDLKKLSAYVDLMLPRIQVPSLAAKVAAEGKTSVEYKVYAVVNTKEFVEDNRLEPVLVDGKHIGGKLMGYLISADHYAEIVAAASTYVGTGTGNLVFQAKLPTAPGVYTVTATSPTQFAVAGPVAAVVDVGVMYDDASITVMINEGSVPFVAGDVFTFTVVAKTEL